MPESLFLDAIKLCYDISTIDQNGDYDRTALSSKNNTTNSDNNNDDSSLITLALASGLPQYFAMLYTQLKEEDDVTNGCKGNNNEEDGSISDITMSALIKVLSLNQPNRFDSTYTYPQFCSTVLEQFDKTYYEPHRRHQATKPSPQLKLPTMQSHLDDLLKSTDWQWQSMECLNERFLLNKLTTSSYSSSSEQQSLPLPDLHTLRLYDLEIENLTRQVVHKNVENDVLKTVCHDLCSHIRRVDSTCLALRVKLERNSLLKNTAEFAATRDDESEIRWSWNSNSNSNSSEHQQQQQQQQQQRRISMATNFAAAVKRNGSIRKLKKINSRLVKQMHTISNKMTTLRRTLSDAAPFVRRLEEIFVNSKRSNSPSTKFDEKQPNSAATGGNSVSVADSGWMSDDDMQFSEAMTTSGASDMFVQSAPIENDVSLASQPPTARAASVAAAGTGGTEKNHQKAVPVADDLSEVSSRRSERMPQYSSSCCSAKKAPNPSLQETDDDEEVFYCEKDYDGYCQRPEEYEGEEEEEEEEKEEEELLDDEENDDDDDDEEGEDTTTRELKSKLFIISQRLNEAEAKLHRVLRSTN